ncbi:MAG: 3-hydroxyacyl-CoA dehydrogenase NAD-binding domain-containing protein [Pseudomonadota bacterium]
MRQVKTVGIAGTGVIGSAWAARAMFHGMDVLAFDPAPGAEEAMREHIGKAWAPMAKLHGGEPANAGKLAMVATPEELGAQVDFVQENAPEKVALKQDLLAAVDAAADEDVIIASSTSGIMPSDLQAKCQKRPERVIVGHPFNPVYLLPLVEVVPGAKQDQQVIEDATTFYTAISMYPLRVRKEVPGHISDRLQEAYWREALHMVNDGVATPKELDDAICYGPGLRLAIMGTCLTFHLAGGDGGIRHMLDHFGPALKWPWTKLEAPELTQELIDRMSDGCEAQQGDRSIRELENLRDNCLVEIMQVLAKYEWAAGQVLNAPKSSMGEQS